MSPTGSVSRWHTVDERHGGGGDRLMNVRALGPLWLVLLVVLCCLASGWEPVKRMFTTPVSYCVARCIALGGRFSVVWTSLGGSLSGQAEATDAPLVGTFLQGFIRPERDAGLPAPGLGYFGWLDRAASDVDLLDRGGRCIRRRRAAAFIATAVTPISCSTVWSRRCSTPALVQGLQRHQTGLIWQGRYALFLYLGIVIVAAWLMSREWRGPSTPRVARRLGRGLARRTYGVLAFFVVLERYVIGAGPIREMLTAPEWQPRSAGS